MLNSTYFHYRLFEIISISEQAHMNLLRKHRIGVFVAMPQAVNTPSSAEVAGQPECFFRRIV